MRSTDDTSTIPPKAHRERFRELARLASQVPEVFQPAIIAVFGTIPFVEGELASVIGVWAGLSPVLAGVAAATGNFPCVAVIVVFGARIRGAVLARRGRSTAAYAEGTAEESAGRQRLRRYLKRFGVPGATLLGPLAIPTQFTAAILVSIGVSKRWILLWQAIAIILWTSAVTLIATGAITFLT